MGIFEFPFLKQIYIRWAILV